MYCIRGHTYIYIYNVWFYRFIRIKPTQSNVQKNIFTPNSGPSVTREPKYEIKNCRNKELIFERLLTNIKIRNRNFRLFLKVDKEKWNSVLREWILMSALSRVFRNRYDCSAPKVTYNCFWSRRQIWLSHYRQRDQIWKSYHLWQFVILII